MTDMDMLSELDSKDLDYWLCHFGDCPRTATHQWDLVSGEVVYVCPFHTSRDSMTSIMNETDHIPTLQDMFFQGIGYERTD